MNSDEIKEFVFKITVLGNSAVGKTSLINQYIEHSFKEDYKPTLGANIIRKDVFVDEINAKCRLILWDLAGQEKYQIVRSLYFQGCVGALLVYDITRHNTFNDIEGYWLKDFKRYVKKEGSYILIGNKMDLDDQRTVPEEEGRKFAEEIKASDFIETSAKFNQNVDLAFKNLVYQILRNHGEEI